MKTTENNNSANALIAEFMGLINYTVKANGNILEKGKFTSIDYKNNWSDLMLAVEKIESLHESNNILIGTSITYVQIHNKVSNEQETFKGVSNIKIEAVYNAVVSFIEWYNSAEKE